MFKLIVTLIQLLVNESKLLRMVLLRLGISFFLLLVTGVLVWIAIRLTRFRISAPGKLSWVRHHPKEVTLVVLLAGFIAGAAPKAREALTEGLVWLLKRGKS